MSVRDIAPAVSNSDITAHKKESYLVFRSTLMFSRMQNDTSYVPEYYRHFPIFCIYNVMSPFVESESWLGRLVHDRQERKDFGSRMPSSSHTFHVLVVYNDSPTMPHHTGTFTTRERS